LSWENIEINAADRKLSLRRIKCQVQNRLRVKWD